MTSLRNDVMYILLVAALATRKQHICRSYGTPRMSKFLQMFVKAGDNTTKMADESLKLQIVAIIPCLTGRCLPT